MTPIDMTRPAEIPAPLCDRLGAVFAGRTHYVAAARRIVNCPALAEDVVQDVMLRLAVDPPRSPVLVERRYVARMVRNLAIDRVRRARFETRTFSGLDEAASLRAETGDPERSAVAMEGLRRAAAAVAALPEPVRSVFRLHRIEGVPQTEIAARMGVSRALVCSLVRRGHVRCLRAIDGTPCDGRACPLDPAEPARGCVGNGRITAHATAGV